jgi:DNA-binding transcriptional ArsR family regulator
MPRRRSAGAPGKLVGAAPLFAALGDQTRLSVVARLCTGGPQSIVRLTSGTKVSRQAITKHLHALARAGVVHSKRDGRKRIWEVRTSRLAEARGWLDRISAQWDEAIDRLRALVESDQGYAGPVRPTDVGDSRQARANSPLKR